MSFDFQKRVDPRIANLRTRWWGGIEGRAWTNMEGRRAKVNKSRSARSGSHGNKWISFSFSYFSIESLLILLGLTASLLILPVILPPLPPPPFMLLLLPIAILVVLLVLAFMPSDVRDIASTYV